MRLMNLVCQCGEGIRDLAVLQACMTKQMRRPLENKNLKVEALRRLSDGGVGALKEAIKGALA